MKRQIQGLMATALVFFYTNLNATTYYVNSITGSDSYDGTSSVFISGTKGPTKSITTALGYAVDGDTLDITGMFTTEPVINTKSVVFNFNNTTEVGNLYINCTTGVTVAQGADVYVHSSLDFINGILNCVGRVLCLPSVAAASPNPTSYAIGNYYIGVSGTSSKTLNFSIGNNSYGRNFDWILQQNSNDTNYYKVELIQGVSPSLKLPNTCNGKSFVHYYRTSYIGSAVPSNFTYRLHYGNLGVDDEVSDSSNLRMILAKSGIPYYTDLGGVGLGLPNGYVSNTISTDDTGIVSLANAIGGTNALGSTVPIVDFEVQNTCENRLTKFTDKSFISSSSGASIVGWFWDFGTGNSADTSNTKNPTFTYTTAGVYAVKLVSKASNGSKDSLTKNIVIGENPTVDYTIQSACFLDSVKFVSLSAVPDGIKTYAWQYGDGNKSTNNASNQSYKYAAANNYTSKLVVTSTLGCMDSLTKGLTVFGTPAAAATVSGNCTADSVVFEGFGGVAGDDVVDWKWHANGTVFTTQNFKRKLITSTGVIAKLVVTSASGCKDSVTVNKAIWESPKAVIYLDNSVPGNDSIQCFSNNFYTLLNASTYPTDQGIIAELLWGDDRISDDNDFSFTKSGAQDVTMRIVTDKGCFDSLKRTYFTNFPEPVTMDKVSKCLSDSVKVFGLPNSIAANRIVAYNWLVEGNKSTTLKDTFLFKATDTGDFVAKMWLTLTDGCTDTATVQYRMEPLPTFKIDTIGKMPFCPGDSVIIKVTGGIGLVWTDGNTNATRSFTAATNQGFTITDGLGCKASGNFVASLYPKPVAVANNDTSIVKGSTITLMASGGKKYLWIPSGATSKEDTAVTTATPLATRTISVIVTDTNGCKDTADVVISITTAGNVNKIMNLLSPNGDNKNDVWDLSQISNIDKAHIRVYNSRGALVWEKPTGYTNDWNGIDMAGKNLPSDTYLYIIEIQNTAPLKGYLQIIQK